MHTTNNACDIEHKQIYLELEAKNKELEENIKLLHVKKESLKLAQEVGHFGSWEIDLTTHKSIWSEQSYKIYKLDPDTTSPTLETFTSRVIEEDQKKLERGMASLIDGKIHSLVLRVKRYDDVIITILINGKYIFNDEGTPIKMVGTTLDITEHIALQQKNESLTFILEHSNNEIYILDGETYQYIYANQHALDKLQYTRDELYKMNITDINKSLTLNHAKKLHEALLLQGTLVKRTIHTKKNGDTYPVESHVQYQHYNNKEVAILFDRDITEHIKEEEIHNLHTQILEKVNDAIISTDLNGIITHWNLGASKLHGYSADDILGKHINTLFPEDDYHVLEEIGEQALLYGSHQNQIIKILTSNNHSIDANITVTVLKNKQGDIIGLTYYAQDITQQKKVVNELKNQQALLHFQATHDNLTKLPNRELFVDRLKQSIYRVQRLDEKFALFLIDIDNFKQVNDTLGHQHGDEVIKIIAERLSTHFLNEDTLSRIGGDEFALLRQNLETPTSAAKIAEEILEILKPKIVINGHTIYITASIGISLYPKDSISQNDLLKYADTAMYRAKTEGGNTYQFYSPKMTQLAFEKAVMSADLHQAIEEKQFVIHYQPQIDTRDNHIVGIEALVRWDHPKMGLIFPDKFLSVAEESQFIQELDYYIMSQAMTDIQQLYAIGLNPGVLSLNLTIKHLMNPLFIQTLSEIINTTKFNIRWLEFEITESQMMNDPIKSIEVLQAISNMGIRIAIDDFGTGHSSLAYLKKLPVHKVKIDKSFMHGLPDDEEDSALTNAVIGLAKSFKLSLVAEGVEKQKQIEYLMQHECYVIQGHYYSKALSKDDLTTYLQNNIVIPLNA